MTNSRDALVRAIMSDDRLNPAIRRPARFGTKKDLKVLEGYVPLKELPGYLWPNRIPGRLPPTMYYGYPVPAHLLEKHWNEEVRPNVDISRLSKKALEVFQDQDPQKAFKGFLVTVLLHLEDDLSDQTGWGIEMNQVYGMPGDPYRWMASLRGNYSGTKIPEPRVRRLREALGAEGPPMWYLADGDEGQWDTKEPLMRFDPQRLLRALGRRE